MKLIIIITILMSIAACTSAPINKVFEARKACRSGLSEYDDGDLTFKCQPKQ